MIEYLLYYISLILWCLYVYGIGIFIKLYKLNIFEIHLFLTMITIYGFFFSHITLFMDKNHPNENLKILINLSKIDKIKILISCLPFNKLIIIAYIDMDPIIITLLNTVGIVFNYIISSLINKKYYLFNCINITSIIVNIASCILPFIFYDNFYLKINSSTKIGIIGLTTTILSVFLNTLSNLAGEQIKYINNFDIKKNSSLLSIYSFFIVEFIFYILSVPLFYLFQQNIFGPYEFDMNKAIFIHTFAIFIALFYGPFYVFATKGYLMLNAIDIAIIRNISLILTTLISCIAKLAPFYYLYIPSIFLIIITSIILVKNINLNLDSNKNSNSNIDIEI